MLRSLNQVSKKIAGRISPSVNEPNKGYLNSRLSPVGTRSKVTDQVCFDSAGMASGTMQNVDDKDYEVCLFKLTVCLEIK